jgi:hypothetical protein
MLAAPNGSPSALGASHTSGIGSFGTSVSRSTATIRGELEETKAKSPMLAVDGAAKGRYRGGTGRAAGQRKSE